MAVEVALLLLVLAPLVLYAIFFTEVGLARLKAREASRYLAWESAATALSDWADGDHRRRFAQVRQTVLREVVERWGDDLDGATPTLAPSRAAALLSVSAQVLARGCDLQEGETAEPSAGETPSATASGAAFMLRRFGFDPAGHLQATVDVAATSHLLGRMPFLPARLLQTDRLELLARQSLLADTWSLDEGRAVEDSRREECASLYCRQVQRMLSAGAAEAVPALGDEGSSRLLGALGIHSPFVAALASLRLDGSEGSDSALELTVADPHGHSAMRRHHTNAFKDTFVRARSALFQSYQRRGAYYLGCPEPQRPEGGCTYEHR